MPDVGVRSTSPEDMGAFLDPLEVLAVVEVAPGSWGSVGPSCSMVYPRG